MELPWNICPYCGTPAPGMRKEGGTLEEVARSLPEEKLKTVPDVLEQPSPQEEAKVSSEEPVPAPPVEGEKPQPEISDEPSQEREEQAKS
jgi:hypothetical protein